jgi:hypothetical protein
METEGRIVREGAVAGLIGAATVAVWFLLFDIFEGAPLQTPTVLWYGLVRGGATSGAVTAAIGPVIGYTVIHVVAFVLFGIVAAWLVAGAEREPAMLLALLIFFGAFEVFFLALVTFLARPVLGVVAWWAILIGNFLAAVTMLWYFFVQHRELARTLGGRWIAVFREGIVAGLLGGVVVALWFLVYDWGSGRPLRTPALLGSALFEGLRDPSRLQIHLDVVLGYTVLHFAAFAAFGILTGILVTAAEREPRILLGLFILFWSYELFFLGFVSAVDEALVGALHWWNIAIANLLAAVTMLVYFFLHHRSLGTRLLERWSED